MREKIVAIVLQFIFLFPLVYNPSHFLFVEHFHSNFTQTPKVEKYHKICSIDDFNIGESTDIIPVDYQTVVFLKTKLKSYENVEIILLHQDLGFLLRAPPCSNFI